MVLVMLGSVQFEALKFETRTMPTPDLKGKEVIYWIKVETEDRRIATDILRFLNGAPKVIELKVPSAFIVASTELETYRPQDLNEGAIAQSEQKKAGSKGSNDVVVAKQMEPQQKTEDSISSSTKELEETRTFVIEIVLRRALSGQSAKQSQSPYG